MTFQIVLDGQQYSIDRTKPLDLSIPFTSKDSNVRAWYCDPVSIKPVVMGDFIGSVEQGGTVNFRDIKFNPHGNGTHTEGVGHISKEWFSVNHSVSTFLLKAVVISVSPQKIGNDLVITSREFKTSAFLESNAEALIIRTLPNDISKKNRDYTETNPPYLSTDAMSWIVEKGFDHLLIDLPSVDKESDDGKLAGHKKFWNYPQSPEFLKTITEFIYVSDEVKDGVFLLDLQVAPFENDASPSRPVLYALTPMPS